MSKEIGFSRAIKPHWIKKTAELLKNTNYDFDMMHEELKEYLSYEMKSPTNIRKTLNIMDNLFLESFDKDLDLMKIVIDEILDERLNNLPIYWSMMCLTYSIFQDIAEYIGKVFTMQDQFTTKWLLDRMYEEWGERSTLKYSTEKILQTLVSMEVLYRKKQGVYGLKKHNINDEFNKKIILYTMLEMNENCPISFDTINNSLLMFPFIVSYDHEWIYFQDNFELVKLGDSLLINKK